MRKILSTIFIIVSYLQLNAQNLTSLNKPVSLPSVPDNYIRFSAQVKEASPKWLETNMELRAHPDANRINHLLPSSTAVEVVSKRTASTSYYMDEKKENTIYLQKALGDINYLKQGDWLRIDTRLEHSSDGQFIASHQPEPVGFDINKQSSFIKDPLGTISFNRWTLSGIKSGQKIKLAVADWSHYTAGDDGIKVFGIFPGMDAEMRVRKGGIKTSFIVNTLAFQDYETLLFEDSFGDENTYSLSAEEGKEFSGKVWLKKNNENILEIAKGIMHPLRGTKDDMSDIVYEVNKNHLTMKIPVSYLKKFEKGGVVIDPVVTSSATILAATITGSMYNASCSQTASCDYSTTITIPAQTSITNLTATASWNSIAPCFFEDGSIDLIVGSCTVGRVTSAGAAGSPGGTYGTVGVFYPFCYPTPLCTAQTMPVGIKFFRSCKGVAGCDGACIGPINPIVFNLTASTVVYKNAAAPVYARGGDYCLGQTVPVSTKAEFGVPPYTYEWSTSSTFLPLLASTDTANLIISGVGTYTIYNRITDACSNSVNGSSPSIVNIRPLATAPTVTTPVNYCIGGVASALTATKASATDTLLWHTLPSGGTGTKIAPTPITSATGSTIFYVSAKSSFGCEGNRTSITVAINPLATNPSVTTPLNYCIGGTATALTATTGSTTDTLYWYSVPTAGSGTKTAPIPATSPATSTLYYVSARTIFGCEGNRTPLTVTINPLPTAPIVSTPINYCIGSSAVALTATKSAVSDTLYWYLTAGALTGSTLAPTPITSSSGSVMYYVSSKSVSGCESNRVPLTVTINPLATAPTVTTPVNYCIGAPALVLSATRASSTDTLFWYTMPAGGSGSKTSPTPLTSATGSTIYYVSSKSSLNCEGNRTPLTVTINALPPAPTVTTPLQLCIGGPTSSLSAAGTSLLWYASSTATTGTSTAPTPSTTSAGTTNYFVTQTNSFTTCESPKATISVVVNNLPSSPIVLSPLNLCIGSTALPLTATGTNLRWYNTATSTTGSSTAPTPITASTSSINYYVSQTSAIAAGFCESNRALLTVNIKPLPIVSVSSLSPAGYVFCKGLFITLKANSATATSYQWGFGGSAISTGLADTIDADKTGFWNVTVTDMFNCKNKDSAYTRQDTSTGSILSPTSAQICEEGNALLTCSPGFVTYSFKYMKDGTPLLPATLKENLKNATIAGRYNVIVTNNFGCIDTTNNCMVTYYPRPIKPVIINANPELSVPNIYRYYQWYRNNKIMYGANKHKLITSSPGNYSVEVTDENGCINDADTIEIKQTLAIDNFVTKTDLKIYPNPTQNRVYIETPVIVNIMVTDMVGRLLLQMKNAREIDLSNFAQGNYLLKITDENNLLITVEKITKIN